MEQHIDVLRTQSDQDCAHPGDSQEDQPPGRQAAARPYRASQEQPEKDKDTSSDESRVHHRVKR
jgi:hypothetical protein